MAAYAQHHGIDHVLLGEPMGFWKHNMPEGMVLRSACDWHLDPFELHTIERYLEGQGLTPKDVEPLSLAFYLGYAEWFQQQKQVSAISHLVQRLDHLEGQNTGFEAVLDDGRTITADQVVVALGFRHFPHVPTETADLLAPGCYSHTCNLVEFEALRGKRCLIVGGRQSAFEWAALLREGGAARVHISHRHRSPAFAQADWSWVSPLVDAMVDDPGWFRDLSQAEKDSVNQRLWAEGRLKIEPWLEARVRHETVTVRPETQLTACELLPSGELRVRLNGSETLEVDHIVFATGYKMNIGRVPFLAAGKVLGKLATKNGYPVLDHHFETNVPGLFIIRMPAVQDFGPFFAFTVSVRTSARLIGQAIRSRPGLRS